MFTHLAWSRSIVYYCINSELEHSFMVKILTVFTTELVEALAYAPVIKRVK